MTEHLKYIVAELAKPPFNKAYNLISFDALEPIQRLQVLNDIFSEIEPKNQMDIRQEAADQTAVRMLAMLRAVQYKVEGDGAAFRQGLVQGEKSVVYAIMHWCLQQMPKLKKNAYLAKYLQKVTIPDWVKQDNDAEVEAVLAQYDELIEKFKEVHKAHTALANSGFSTADIKKDIENMEEEKEQVSKRIERVKKKVESVPNREPMLAVAKNLRMEKEREQELATQRQEQENSLMLAGQRIERVQQHLQEIRAAGIKTTPEDLMQQLEEEAKTNEYLVGEKYPKEIDILQAKCGDLQRVASFPAMGQSDLDELNKQIKDVNAQINQLIEKKMISENPEDKTALFRQQAAIVNRKKEAAAETLAEARSELSTLESELEEKKNMLKDLDVGDALKGDDFKRYVAKLRGKNTSYRKYRAELSEIRAEVGVLMRTVEILKDQSSDVSQDLKVVEAKHGVSGFLDTQEELEKISEQKSILDEQKGRTLENISEMVQQLHNSIATKKSALAPIIKELRPMRQKCQEITQEYDEKKAAYDSLATKLESSRSQLEQEAKSLWDEFNGLEGKRQMILYRLDILQVQEGRCEKETAPAVDPKAKHKSLREQYNKLCSEQENIGKQLREKQKEIRENQEMNVKQMKMWSDFLQLMQCKQRIAEGQLIGSKNNANSGSMNHLVL